MPTPGRPSVKTAHVRVAGDLAAKLRVLKMSDGIDHRERLDPLIRPVVEAAFAKLPKALRDLATAGD